VQETAKKMGYMPNFGAKALKTNRTYNLGVLFADKAHSGLTHSYFASVLNSFKNEAEANGYDITFISNNIGKNPLTFYEHCVSRNVDGVMVVNVDDYGEKGITELLESPIPVVTLDRKTASKPAVLSDNYSGMQELVKYICGKGHRKIAYIYGDAASVTSTRLDSFRETLTSLNIDINEDCILEGRYHDPNTTEVLTEKLMKLPDPPTCIILPDDFSAVGALNAFEKMGLQVPEDISVAGFDGITLSQVLCPKLTTFRQDTDKLGKLAAKRLISMISGERIPDDGGVITVSGWLLAGASVKDVNPCK
jgi:DNA-binding LacI/PurR family transcriptional regulator